MIGSNRLTSALHRLVTGDVRRAPSIKRAPATRPVLERLESIDLLSTLHAHASAHEGRARVGEVSKSVGIQTILPINYGVTGIRQNAGGNVVITGGTGSPSLTGGTPAFIYSGPLNQIPSNTSASSLHLFYPKFSGQTVTSSQFYGPNTPLFDPAIGSGNITAVGAYRSTASTFQLGMIYTGPLDGSGTYTELAAPGNGKSSVGDTIPHSTMGKLVVGNFDYQNLQARGHGFLYDTSSRTYQTVDIGRFGTTLYGVWQNGGPQGTSYTLVGGFSGNGRAGKAFIEDYNATTHRFSHFRSYSLNNNPSIVTHFEGISAVPGGFSIAASGAGAKGAVASIAFIPVRRNGSFGPARWVNVTNQVGGGFTSADTVINSTVLGIYSVSGVGAASYIATVPSI